jgi:hypothetical protein
MLIVPELEIVFILVPRTGSGTLYKEMRRAFPRSMLLYRHMEADGVPQGYDRWRRIGFMRHPFTRLLSLYNFMRDFRSGSQLQHDEDTQRIRNQCKDRSFVEWLELNDQIFTSPNCLSGTGESWPLLSRRDPAPENKRSQFSYLRPDLGTEVHKLEDLEGFMAQWGLNSNAHHNKSSGACIGVEEHRRAMKHIERYCAWDLSQGCKII